jgi:acetyltransferase-like isoleucine patch superfamily enzyme
MIGRLVGMARALWFLRRPEALRALGEIAAERAQRERAAADHPGLVLEAGVQLIGYAPERLRGAGGRVASGTVLSFGDDDSGYGSISIGAGSWIGQYNNIRTSEGAPIEIGEKCLVSQFCTLIAANHGVSRAAPVLDQPHDERRRGVRLADDVWLGAGCVVLPGVTIARGSVIGANSVLSKSTGEYEIWVGAPAQRVGERPA